MKVVVRAALLSLLLSAPARAHEVEVGTALICDTQHQVERFVSFMRGDARSAVNAVNAEEHNETACAMSRLAFLRGSTLATVLTKEETFQITEILVVGVVTAAGMQPVVPYVYISLFKVEELPA
jgi:uncharacterized membrane protein YraQ (UPF0718 family)